VLFSRTTSESNRTSTVPNGTVLLGLTFKLDDRNAIGTWLQLRKTPCRGQRVLQKLLIPTWLRSTACPIVVNRSPPRPLLFQQLKRSLYRLIIDHALHHRRGLGFCRRSVPPECESTRMVLLLGGTIPIYRCLTIISRSAALLALAHLQRLSVLHSALTDVQTIDDRVSVLLP
jgi:hypothetical protein